MLPFLILFADDFSSWETSFELQDPTHLYTYYIYTRATENQTKNLILRVGS